MPARCAFGRLPPSTIDVATLYGLMKAAPASVEPIAGPSLWLATASAIVHSRYCSDEPHTYRELGTLLNLSPERVRTTEDQALRLLRCRWVARAVLARVSEGTRLWRRVTVTNRSLASPGG